MNFILDRMSRESALKTAATKKINKKHLRGILEFYRKEGFSIALDDVGEGYSGLNNLIDIKPNIIKADRNVIEPVRMIQGTKQ